MDEEGRKRKMGLGIIFYYKRFFFFKYLACWKFRINEFQRQCGQVMFMKHKGASYHSRNLGRLIDFFPLEDKGKRIKLGSSCIHV